MVSFDAFVAHYVDICNENPEKSEVDCLWNAVLDLNTDLYFDVIANYPEIYDETSFFVLIKKLQQMWH